MPKGRSTGQSVKLLIILDYLYSHTNADHYVNSRDIIAHLASHGINADRKTIFTDIDKIQYDYGVEIERHNRKGYRIANPKFEPHELRLMIDSVQSARFITETEAATLTSKIKDLADVYTKPSLERKAYVSERIRDSKESVVARTDVIFDAMTPDVNAQVSFKYVHYYPSFKETKRYSKEGQPYVVSPFALYWNNGNYYLYAYVSEKERFQFFRIDRMESIKITSKKRDGQDKFSSSVLESKPKAKVFDMYQTGNEVKVRLLGINKVADQVVDAFGNKIMLMPDKEDGHFTADVLVDVSPTFFAWVSTFGTQLKIAAPEKTKNEYVSFLHESLDQY